MFKPTQEDIDFIKANYMTMNSKDIAEKLGCSRSYVSKIGKEISGGKKPRYVYYCNFNYFDLIDTYEKAYWLGFIMADGCVYKRKKNEKCQKWLRITLQKDDEKHLEKFKKAIESNHRISTITRKKDNRQYCSILIVNNDMVEALGYYGCTERKTGKIQFPSFTEDNLIWGFIHGYLDGDGSISITKENRYTVRIVGNLELLSSMQEFLISYGIEAKIREDKRDYSFPFYELYVGKIKDINTFFENTYNKNIISLDRKLDRVYKFYQDKSASLR